VAAVVQEAGGRFTSLEGDDGPLGSDALATNGKLHDQVLAFVGTLPEDEREPGREGRVHDLSAHRNRVTPRDQAEDPVE
jgi:histidinol-phosphatase